MARRLTRDPQRRPTREPSLGLACRLCAVSVPVPWYCSLLLGRYAAALRSRLGLSGRYETGAQRRDARDDVDDVLPVARTVHRDDRQVVRSDDADDEGHDVEQADAHQRALGRRRREAGHGDQQRADEDVNDIVHRVDAREPEQQLVARVREEVAEAGYEESEDADGDVRRADQQRGPCREALVGHVFLHLPIDELPILLPGLEREGATSARSRPPRISLYAAGAKTAQPPICDIERSGRR